MDRYCVSCGHYERVVWRARIEHICRRQLATVSLITGDRVIENRRSCEVERGPGIERCGPEGHFWVEAIKEETR